jgi:hypothetical protein
VRTIADEDQARRGDVVDHRPEAVGSRIQFLRPGPGHDDGLVGTGTQRPGHVPVRDAAAVDDDVDVLQPGAPGGERRGAVPEDARRDLAGLRCDDHRKLARQHLSVLPQGSLVGTMADEGCQSGESRSPTEPVTDGQSAAGRIRLDQGDGPGPAGRCQDGERAGAGSASDGTNADHGHGLSYLSTITS